MSAKPKIISLFSGALGLDLGLERAGFEVAVALECDKHAIATIRENRKNLPLIAKPIEDVTTREILEAGGLKPGEAFAVVGGPACQAFSTAGQRKSFDDLRGNLFSHFERIVNEAQPKYFVMENVKGLISAAIKHRPLNQRGPGFPFLLPEEELGSAFRVMADALAKLNYYSIFDVLNSANFGTPQTRQRLVIIGSRDGKKLSMPKRTHSKDGSDGLKKWKTIGEAFSELPDLDPIYCDFTEKRKKYFMLVPEGGNWRDLPDELKEEALGKAFHSWGGRSGFYRRLNFNKPSPTLTTSPDNNATALCHPQANRPLSVQEYAAIQDFPSDWNFSGGIRAQYKQVGNAVPLELGHAIGKALKIAEATRASKKRKGKVESFNIQLLANLCKRPTTILNPIRMHKNVELEELNLWKLTGQRLRVDAFHYVPDTLEAELLIKTNRKNNPLNICDATPVICDAAE